MCRKEARIPLGSEQGTSLQTSLAALAQRVWVPPPMQGEWHGADQHRARQRGNCSPKGQQTAGNIGKERACPEEHKNTPNGRKYLTFLPPEKILDMKLLFSFCHEIPGKNCITKEKGLFHTDHQVTCLFPSLFFLFLLPFIRIIHRNYKLMEQWSTSTSITHRILKCALFVLFFFYKINILETIYHCTKFLSLFMKATSLLSWCEMKSLLYLLHTIKPQQKPAQAISHFTGLQLFFNC